MFRTTVSQSGLALQLQREWKSGRDPNCFNQASHRGELVCNPLIFSTALILWHCCRASGGSIHPCLRPWYLKGQYVLWTNLIHETNHLIQKPFLSPGTTFSLRFSSTPIMLIGGKYSFS
jgi:hypothetical protein